MEKMGNEVSGLIPSFDEGQKAKSHDFNSFANMSFDGTSNVMKSFDERGAGRRVAANLAAADSEDEHRHAHETGEDEREAREEDGSGGEDEVSLSHKEKKTVRLQEDVQDEVPPKRYTWNEIPQSRLPREDFVFFMRGGAPSCNLQRKTKKIIEQYSSNEDVYALQEQEQERAIDLQRTAIEKVLLTKYGRYSKNMKQQSQPNARAQQAVQAAKKAAFNVQEYNTYSKYMFLSHAEYSKNKSK